MENGHLDFLLVDEMVQISFGCRVVSVSVELDLYAWTTGSDTLQLTELAYALGFCSETELESLHAIDYRVLYITAAYMIQQNSCIQTETWLTKLIN